MKIQYPLLAGAGFLFLSITSAFAQGQNPGRRATDAVQPAASDNRYLIEFRAWGPQARAAVNSAGGQVIREFPGLRSIAARMAPQAARALENNPSVNFVEVDPRRYMMARKPNPGWTEVVPYGISMVQADQITNANPSNRKVCIIDSGYYMGHEDLQDTSVTASPDKNTGNPYTDAFGHGTHVAGTIAALANRVGVVGVNSGGVLNLHIVKVFGDDGIWAYSSNLIAALDECRRANANVVSMSLGGDRRVGSKITPSRMPTLPVCSRWLQPGTEEIG